MKRYGLYIAVLIAVLPIIILRDYTPDNELRYLSIADEALSNGNIFAFYNQGIPYADKPPLYIWIVMLGKLIFSTHRMWFLSLFSLIPAFVITDNDNKNFLINTARSFIFSTMIPPFNCEWSQFIIKHIIDMNNEREHLHHISRKLNKFFISIGFPSNSNSQIVPLILKDAHKAISISQQLLDMGYIALPIRTPTVPIGTERIRFSLNSNIPDETIDRLITDLGTLL